MPIESATYINGLNPSNPPGSDPSGEGDDHLRLIKSVLKNTFPNIFAAVTATAAELNQLSGTTITAFAKMLLDDVDAASARLTLAAAARGANSDITSLSGLLTPLSISQGGTGASTAAAAIAALVAPGAAGNVMTSNGTTWISAAPSGSSGAVNVQTFNYTGGNQTWVKPSFGTIAIVECWGGGGSGAKTNSTTTAAGGGGGGNYVMQIFPLSSLPSTVTVYVGAGGSGVSGTSSDGNDGQSTSFWPYVVASGGGRGLVSGRGGGGGAAGTASHEGRNGGGNGGGSGSIYSITTGSTFGGGGGGGDYSPNGGGSMFGGGGGGAGLYGSGGAMGLSYFGGDGGNGAYNTNAIAGTPGGGGGGGCMSTNPSHTSGAGAFGVCRVTVF